MDTFQLSDCLAPTHMEFGLDRMQRLMAAMGNPHDGLLTAIHIAGTNGKGSVAAYLTSILLAGGFSVGTTTSPHLVTERERIAINGQPIDALAIQTLCQQWLPLFQKTGATYFEAMTALAFVVFANGVKSQNPLHGIEEGLFKGEALKKTGRGEGQERPLIKSVDWAVIEVGLGGRLDATNVLESPAITVITSIGLDHTEFLGESLAAIATEKAGIGKAGVPMVVGPAVTGKALDAMHAVAKQVGFPVIQAKTGIANGHKNPMLGSHQTDNLATALTVLGVLVEQESLALSQQALEQGIAATRWPARLEVFEHQRIILDGSHNADGFAALAEALDGHPAKNGVWLVSLKQTKAIEPLITAILACQPLQVIVTEGPNEHGGYHSPPMLAEALCDAGYEGVVSLEPDPVKALILLKNHIMPPLGGLVTGSLHTAGVLRPLLTQA